MAHITYNPPKGFQGRLKSSCIRKVSAKQTERGVDLSHSLGGYVGLRV